MKRQNVIAVLILVVLMGATMVAQPLKAPSTVTPTAGTTQKATRPPATPSLIAPTATHGHTPTPGVTITIPAPNVTREPSQPYPGAPLCAEHSNTEFHTLWNAELGCHYDHEHGDDVFTAPVAAVFAPLGDLRTLLGGVEVGHTNPSSPMENTHKHGGMKWQNNVPTPKTCYTGFEGATVGIDNAVVEYHAFGDYSIEMQARIHSILALARQCLPNSTDYGYVFTVQMADYGQRVAGYQGDIIPYGNSPSPAYPDGIAPYFSIDCIGRGVGVCDATVTTREQKLAINQNSSTTWTSKRGETVGGQNFLSLLFRGRDNYQIFDWSRVVSSAPIPLDAFLWMCSEDGGATFSPVAGCRYNNTTTRVHEIVIRIPAAWDNTAMDSDPRNGRITATGFTDIDGDPDDNCTAPSMEPGAECFPFKLVNAYVGQTGAEMQRDKRDQFKPAGNPERDICFTSAGAFVACDTSGAIPSGWIGAGN